MDMATFTALAMACAPAVHPTTLAAVAHVESGFNPLAIGVVGGRLVRQPLTVEEAVATATALEQGGWNFDLGVAQINRHNLVRYGLDYRRAFDPCANLRASSEILAECFGRAKAGQRDEQRALQAALSCYNSGNFTRGFAPSGAQGTSYVQRVVSSAHRLTPSTQGAQR